jgi:DNA-binding NtrC family response regulator
MRTLLIVDDDRSVHLLLKSRVGADYTLLEALTVAQGHEIIATHPEIDAVVLDMQLPDGDGLDVLTAGLKRRPGLPFIVLTAHGSVQGAVEAMRAGAFDYAEKPLDLDHLSTTLRNALAQSDLRREVESLRETVRNTYGFDNAIGESRAMATVFRVIRQVINAKAPVLLTGESGTGKEVLARVIHFNSARKGQPFIAVNCAAIPEELLESELFGHEKGAFTGAQQRRLGKFEEARGGTVLLDEIGEMAPRLQAKLLRVLQEREFERVGSNSRIKLDARIIAATNRDLKVEIAEGRFREDLYYRLNVLTIAVPPLRDRKEDVPRLVHYFLGRVREREGTDIRSVTPEAMAVLQSHNWPGNVRELENTIFRAALIGDDSTISIDSLPPEMVDAYLAGPTPTVAGAVATAGAAPTLGAPTAPRGAAGVGAAGATVPRTLEEAEKAALEAAWARGGGNVSKVARELGISRATLYRKLRQYGLIVAGAGEGDEADAPPEIEPA